nr:PREDICTED: vascular cell adhesion protein 1 [Latimeria chalumnae]|eukprot:XP_006000089.1 PREDICTED: vascular cell adhesion protein 1 [Latimeria chalumnae]
MANTHILGLVLILSTSAFAIKIELVPSQTKRYVPVGEPLMLMCKVTGCESPSFTWRTQLDNPLGGKVNTRGPESNLTFSSVGVENEESYICTGYCGNSKLQKHVPVRVYSFSSDPVIETSKPLVAGQKATLTCKIPKVYPSDFLEVTITKDGKIRKGQIDTSPIISTPSVSYEFTPQPEDDGKEISCEAYFDLEELQPELKTRRTTEKLNVHFAPTNTVISSSSSTVIEGDALTLTCTTESNPPARVVWQKQLPNGEFQQIAEYQNITIPEATYNDSGIYKCEVKNDIGTDAKETKVTIQASAVNVELLPSETQVLAELGKPLVLTCKVTECESPTFSWKAQLDKPLGGKENVQGFESNLTFSSVNKQNENSYTCMVTCDGRQKHKTVSVMVYSFSSDPVIEINSPLLTEQKATLTCRISDVYPLEFLEVKLLKDGAIIKEEFFHDKNLPEVVYEFIPKSEDAGKKVTCEAYFNGPQDTPKKRSTTRELSVHFAPNGTNLLVFPYNTLKEGESAIISCSTHSFPAAKYILRKKSKAEVQVIDHQNGTYKIDKVDINDEGTYECEASNDVGTEKRNTTVLVQVPPRNTTVSIYPSNEVTEGETVTITCKTYSKPPPKITFKKVEPGSGRITCFENGTFILYEVTQNDTGKYEIEVINDIGNETELIDIHVLERRTGIEDPPENVPVIVISIVATLGIVSSAIYIGYKVWQRKLSGTYNLVDPSTAAKLTKSSV